MNGLALSAAECDQACDGGRSLFGLSLCAGAGGLDLGVHLAVTGYQTVGYVERDAYAAATLVARMEDKSLDCAPVWDDIASFDGKPWRGVVDIIHGGYPCQPFSVAGRKLGDKDPRHLWPQVARIVDECQPPLCFFENVGGHLRLGFEQVHDDLQRMGYRVKAGLFTAEEVGASHKRERLFILAYRESFFSERAVAQGDIGRQSQRQARSQCADLANPASAGNGGNASQLSEPNERPDGSMPRVIDQPNNEMADSDGDGCACQSCEIPRKDDPQGRAQCAADTIVGGNGDATAGLSLHETGSGSCGKHASLQIGKDTVADNTGVGRQQGRPQQSTRQRKPASACCGNSVAVVHAECPERRQGESVEHVSDWKTSKREETSSGIGESGDPKMADTARQSQQRPPDQTDSLATEGRAWPQSGNGRRDTNVAHAPHLRGQEIKRGEQDRTDQSMGDPTVVGQQGSGESVEPLHSEEATVGEATQPIDDGTPGQFPTWPPAPCEYERWGFVTPDLKPAVCRVADGMAHRVDRLRLCGNGVVPLAAAYAFRTLAAAANIAID